MNAISRLLSPDRFSHVTYQLFFLGITCATLIALLYRPVVEFHPVGKQPIIAPVTQELITQWNKKPVHVNVGMHITDFLKFDTIKNEFIINAFIWFTFDPRAISADIIDKFTFTKGDIVQKSHVTLKKISDAATLALYTVRIQFSTILDYSRFPLDDHRIFLNLTNQTATADELVYHADANDYIISQNIYVSGWDVVGHTVKSGYAIIPLGTDKKMLQTKTVFTMDLSKSDLRQLSLIMLPLLFLFYLGLFTFSIRDITVAMTLPLASISGLFAYSFVIQTLAPMVGYMMLSDYLFLFFLCSTFVIFLVKALAAVPEHLLSRYHLKVIEGLTIVGLQATLLIVWYFLVDVRGI